MLNSRILLTAVSLFFAAIVSAQGNKKAVADKIVAVVGDRIILYSDIRNSLADIARGGQQLPDNAECLIVEQAVISKVLMLQAEKDSLPVTDEEVEAELDQRIRYFVRELGTLEEVEKYAGKSVYQIKDDARESVRERKLAEAMQQKIVSGVKITPTEVKSFFDKIPKDSLPFFESELEVCQILLYPKASRELEEYMVSQLNNLKKQIESKVITFGQAAKRESEDPGSKDRNGEYQVNRNDKQWDPIFISTAFRLKEGEISAPVKSKFGYHLIKMVEKNGDDAIVAHILKVPPVTDLEINQAIAKLDTVRSKVIAGTVGFNEAAKRYSDAEEVKFSGPCLLNRDGAPYITIDMMDKEMVTTISKMKVGDYSQPVSFTNEQGKKGVRIIYLKSRSEPHRMNLTDDYSKISQMALEQKKGIALDKWMRSKVPTYYIMVDNETTASCPNAQKFASTESRGF